MKAKHEAEMEQEQEQAILKNTANSLKTKKEPKQNLSQIMDLQSLAYSPSYPRDTRTDEEKMEDLRRAEENKSPSIGELIHTRRLQKGLTIREVAEACGVAEGTVSRWEHGVIQNMRRSNITIVSKILDIPGWKLMGWDAEDNHMLSSIDFFKVPVIRQLTNSVSISVSQESVGTIDLSSKDYTRPVTEYFGYEVMDNSMSPDIKLGDILVCHIQEQFPNSSYVLISIDGNDAICRRIRMHEGVVLLLSPNHDPLVFNTVDMKKRHLRIIGVVMEIRRTLFTDH